MSCIRKQLADFGPFTLDFSKHVLWRGEKLIDLSASAVATLECLIENWGCLISKEDLKKKVWPNTAVADSSVYRQICDLRQALGDRGKKYRFIEGKSRQGYRFVASVTERIEFAASKSGSSSVTDLGEPVMGSLRSEKRPEPEPAASPTEMSSASVTDPVQVAPRSSEDNSVTDPRDLTSALSVSHVEPILLNVESSTLPQNLVSGTSAIPSILDWRLAVFLVLCTITGAVLIYRTARTQKPRVVGFQQLSNDGNKKEGPLLSDGHRIFFIEQVNPRIRKVFSIPVSGGEAAPLDLPLGIPSLQAISGDRSTLLLQSKEGDTSKLWAYTIATKVLQRLRTGFLDGAWSPDGRTLAAETADGSSIVISTGSAQRKIYLPEPRSSASSLSWSPDGKKLRFSLLDSKREWSTEWEVSEDDSRPRQLDLESQGLDVGNGTWTPNGKYFVYSASAHLNSDLWIARETPRGPRMPVRLSHGEPGSWTWPSCSADGSTIFALNRLVRSELVRFEKSINSWQPEWDGAAAYELDYSMDGKWVAYTHFPDDTIWKARADGTGSTQLTDERIEAHQPHWSPDATHIAFMGKNKNGKWKVFQLPADGGTADEVLPNGEEQGVPTWSPDGRYLLFGDLLGRKPKTEMSIHLLSLANRRLAELAGSKGLWSPRWSRDGRHIVAVTSDSEAIRVLTWPGTHWDERVRMEFVDNATWSIDSHFVYFDGRPKSFPLGVYRLNISDGRLERLVDLTGFPAAPEGWFGVAPDGSPLAFRGTIRDEIFALKCVLP